MIEIPLTPLPDEGSDTEVWGIPDEFEDLVMKMDEDFGSKKPIKSGYYFLLRARRPDKMYQMTIFGVPCYYQEGDEKRGVYRVGQKVAIPAEQQHSIGDIVSIKDNKTFETLAEFRVIESALHMVSGEVTTVIKEVVTWHHQKFGVKKNGKQKVMQEL